MIVYPNAKINIGLKVIEKRTDGFHNLETFFFPVKLTDILEIVEAKKTTIDIYGIILDGNPLENLCVKAYNLLAGDYLLPPVEIHLFKRIPAGAGLGGGSSDAAYTLIALDKLFDLNLSTNTLAGYAAKIGSDCSFFIYSQSLSNTEGEGMFAQGRGEILSEYIVPQLKGLKIEIVTPSVFVSTSEAYSDIIPNKPQTSLKNLLLEPIEKWKHTISNDFEPLVIKKHPVIGEYKQELYRRGAIYASMTGSGSALFGIYPTTNQK